MSNLIRGKNVFAQLKIDGVFYPVFCAKGATFNSVQDSIETTNINSGAARQYVPGMQAATLDVNGITTADNSNSRVSIIYLLQAAQRRTTFEMRLLMTDENATQLAITFSAFSTTLSINREIGSFSQSNASFQITGNVDIDTTIPAPTPPECEIQDPLYLTLSEAATSVSDALLTTAGVTILEVRREGLQYDETTGTPGNRQFKFTAGTGTISFDPTNPGNPGGESIYVLYIVS